MKTRINGQELPLHISQEVILLGTANKVTPNGTEIELKTTDNKIINISLKEPVNGDITDGYIECHGIVQSKATMLCQNYVHFPEEMCKSFDPNQYNELLSVLNLLGEQKWKLSEFDKGL